MILTWATTHLLRPTNCSHGECHLDSSQCAFSLTAWLSGLSLRAPQSSRNSKSFSQNDFLSGGYPHRSSGIHWETGFYQVLVLRGIALFLWGCQTPTQYRIKIVHPWAQKYYPVLGLRSGERLLGHFQTPNLHWKDISLQSTAKALIPAMETQTCNSAFLVVLCKYTAVWRSSVRGHVLPKTHVTKTWSQDRLCVKTLSSSSAMHTGCLHTEWAASDAGDDGNGANHEGASQVHLQLEPNVHMAIIEPGSPSPPHRQRRSRDWEVRRLAPFFLGGWETVEGGNRASTIWAFNKE